MTTAVLKVTGMSCGHCVQAVTKALQSVEGVSQARVDLKGGTATVEFDATRTDPRALARAVSEEGYEAEETA